MVTIDLHTLHGAGAATIGSRDGLITAEDTAVVISAASTVTGDFVNSGTIIGATIVGRSAGELILPWVLAVKKKLAVGDMASIIAPYPTLSEVSKRVAGAWYTPKLFSARTRTIVGWMQRLP